MACYNPNLPSMLLPMLLLLALTSFAGQAAAELQAFADPRTIDEMESFQLRLRLEGTQEVPEIDTDVLTTDFEIITSNTTSQYRSINGRVQSWVELQLTLRPKRTGKLTVPPITIAGETSRPLQIQVNALDPTIKQAIADMVFFETELSPNPAYVQSEAVLVRRLYYSTSGGVQMYSEMPGAPEIADAVVIALGQTRSYTDQRDSINYGVVEQRFAIVPEKSGNLDIPKVAITSSIRLMKNGRVRRSGIRVSSDALSLEVLPIPPEYPANQPWLAATSLELVELWQPDPPTFVVGEPVTRQVVARVTGNVASAIPPLTTELEGDVFRAYPEPPQLQDNSSDTTNQGTRAETFSLLPSKPGSAQIPPVALTWWNVSSQAVETARLPAKPVQVSQGSSQSAAPNTPITEAPTVPANTAAETQDATAEPIADLRQAGNEGFSSLQISLFGLLVLVLLALVYRQWGQQLAVWLSALNWAAPKLSPGSRGASMNNRPSRPAIPIPTANPKRAFAMLKRDLNTKSLADAKVAAGIARHLKASIVRFAARHQGLSKAQALRLLQQHKATEQLLQNLNQHLYQANAAGDPDTAQVQQAAESFHQALQGRNRLPPLPTLYPTN